jgi:hypothetical protein
VGLSLRRVWTTSAMSAQKRSLPHPWIRDLTGPPLRLTSPAGLRAWGRVDRGDVQHRPWIRAQIRALACGRFRAERDLNVLEDLCGDSSLQRASSLRLFRYPRDPQLAYPEVSKGARK